jgi:Heterokaryon incompatibility protein (HET)
LRATFTSYRAIFAEYLEGVKGSEWRKYYCIEAICIDQSNLSERDAQVQIVGDIYYGAAPMCAYINDTDEEEFRHLEGLMTQTLRYGTLNYDEWSEEAWDIFILRLDKLHADGNSRPLTEPWCDSQKPSTGHEDGLYNNLYCLGKWTFTVDGWSCGTSTTSCWSCLRGL